MNQYIQFCKHYRDIEQPFHTYTIDNNKTIQEHLNILRHPMKCFKTLDVLGISEDWSSSDEVMDLLSFVATSSNLEKMYLSLPPQEDAYNVLRKCMMAARRNEKIVSVELNLLCLNNDNIAKITELIMIGNEKVKEITFDNDWFLVTDTDEIDLFLSTLSSLDNLQRFRVIHDFFSSPYPNLLTFLARRNSIGKVTELELSSYGRPYGDVNLHFFLALKASASVTSCSTKSDLEFLASGVIGSRSIETLELTISMPEKAILLMADYLSNSGSNLKCLSFNGINGGNTRFAQETILSVLCSSTTLRQLSLYESFFDNHCNTRISDLLIRNPNIQSLILYDETGLLDLPAMQNVAEGLLNNSTLRKLQIGLHCDDSASLGPIFDVISSSNAQPVIPSGLQTLHIECWYPHLSNLPAISNPFGQLQELKVNVCDIDEEQRIIPFLSSVQHSNLRSLEMGKLWVFDLATWAEIASILAKLQLLHLVLRCEQFLDNDEELEDSVVRDIHREILDNGIRHNKQLESACIVLPMKGSYDDSDFRSKLNEYCNRNVTIKVSNALFMPDDDSPSNDSASSCCSKNPLPVGCVPRVLTAIHKRSFLSGGQNGTSERQYNELKSTVLYSALRGKFDLCERVLSSA